MAENPNRPIRPRTSLVDGAWDDIPNAIPDDTVVDPTVDSKELTSPDPSRRPAELSVSVPRAPGPSALGLPPASKRPQPPPASAPASRPARTSTPPPPPSKRASIPPSAPVRPSTPPPPPQRASVPPARPSTPPSGPAAAPPAAPKRVPPPTALVDTQSESLEAIVSREAVAAAVPPAALPEPPPAPALPSSLAPTQPSPSVWPAPPSSRAPGLDELPTLQEALTQRVRVGQGAGPLWAFALIAVGLSLGVMAFFSGSCSALVARGTAPAAPPPDKSVARPAASAPPVETPPPPAPPPPARAEPPSDEAVLAALEARPPRERSVDDVLALAAGRAAGKRRALGDDAAKASQSELYASSPELGAKLKSAALDPDTMRDALGSMAKLPSQLGADLLYQTWTTRKKSDPAVALAEALLLTNEVRKKASPALLVALDLRAAESCDAAKEALTRALEHGDRRVVPLLGRFAQKKGCGDDKREDCWACLREGEELKAATKSVATRAPPKL